ncbi:MAG: glycosyltransferase [Coleofasciculus sp. G1-WW12-02]|uniref:glycosyltransferase family 2 protein n=1 Tax=Coleofasciculus sp. G1-WW12-02 TaxID=3068483 RepID=UPI0033022B56
MTRIGVVTIGRNEGERLIRCLKSAIALLPQDTPIIYVDSGSTDGSVEAAESLGVQVINLDMSRPFTMARGRNTGFRYLVEQFPDINYVQFIDGDCELIPGWIEQAIETLDNDHKLAIACGRRRERFPDDSIYNRLADMEWNTPVGEAKACGGDALIRVSAIREVNGYNETLIGGEEPEMCIRMRQRGWKIVRIDADMTYHDAAMLKFSQWWKRSMRGGWAVAEGAAMHGDPPERYMIRESLSGWLWGFVLPVTALSLAGVTSGLSLLSFLGYPVLMWRVYRYRRCYGDLPSHAGLYALFCVLYKLPQVIGQMKYWLMRWRGQQATLIEYKTSI